VKSAKNIVVTIVLASKIILKKFKNHITNRAIMPKKDSTAELKKTVPSKSEEKEIEKLIEAKNEDKAEGEAKRNLYNAQAGDKLKCTECGYESEYSESINSNFYDHAAGHPGKNALTLFEAV
jgi:hypothetical protein